jgi:hypothetical protein
MDFWASTDFGLAPGPCLDQFESIQAELADFIEETQQRQAAALESIQYWKRQLTRKPSNVVFQYQTPSVSSRTEYMASSPLPPFQLESFQSKQTLSPPSPFEASVQERPQSIQARRRPIHKSPEACGPRDPPFKESPHSPPRKETISRSQNPNVSLAEQVCCFQCVTF